MRKRPVGMKTKNKFRQTAESIEKFKLFGRSNDHGLFAIIFEYASYAPYPSPEAPIGYSTKNAVNLSHFVKGLTDSKNAKSLLM